jgi:hypothetical protein
LIGVDARVAAPDPFSPPAKTSPTTSRTTNLLPNSTAQSISPATTLPPGVDASLNRILTRFLPTSTTSRTPFSRTAVSSERGEGLAEHVREVLHEQIQHDHIGEDVDQGRREV